MTLWRRQREESWRVVSVRLGGQGRLAPKFEEGGG